jgi:predicted site-specific integrase-resolvase
MPFMIDGHSFFKTSEACRLAGTNRATFLRWVRESKFADVGYRDRNGWRLFTDEDIQRLKNKANNIKIIPNIR